MTNSFSPTSQEFLTPGLEYHRQVTIHRQSVLGLPALLPRSDPLSVPACPIAGADSAAVFPGAITYVFEMDSG